ncbi:Hypothetical protein, putative [Bodo saltans]|uniref:Uncharacterized protein n=1 Tax=Bodo saltans TaxID=75058 RepID=A0A0S4IY25_BODSA|nr:Hypothetical protein, putative [Bodo saltans]|eukprot:CUG09053.1 Hypothetical protein, putative [Bodo saltans]
MVGVSSRRTATTTSPQVQVANSSDIESIALWLNERPRHHKSQGQTRETLQPPSSASSSSLFGMLRSLLSTALLDGSHPEDDIIVLAEDVQASIVLSLSSEMYGQLPPPAHNKQKQLSKLRTASASGSLGTSTSNPAAQSSSSISGHCSSSSSLSPALLRAVQVATGMFRVPTDALWRQQTEIECVLCAERFIVDYHISLSSHCAPENISRAKKATTTTKKAKSSTHVAASSSNSNSSSSVVDLRKTWCDDIVAHAVNVHLHRGKQHSDYFSTTTSSIPENQKCAALQQQQQRKPFGKRDRDGHEPRPAVDWKNRVAPYSIETAMSSKHIAETYSIPLRTLQSSVIMAATTSDAAVDGSGDDDQHQKQNKSSHHRHESLRHISVLTDLVFREALLCPCSSAAWLREEDDDA